MHFSRFINHWGHLRRDQTALVCGDARLTWGELAHQSRAMAAAYQDMGVRRGDRVGCLLDNSLEWCVAYAGSIMAGAALVPLNTAFGYVELREIERDAGCSLVVSTPRLIEKLGVTGLKQSPYDIFIFARGQDAPPRPYTDATLSATGFVPPAVTDEDVFAIPYTSGTTGAPKGVMMTHRSTETMCSALSLGFGLSSEERVLVVAPLAYTGGFICNVAPILWLGAMGYIERQFDPGQALGRLTGERITSMAGVPAFFQRIAEAPGFDQADLSNLVHTTTGGAPVPQWLLQKYRQKGVVLRHSYGCTEGGGNVTLPDPQSAIERPGACGPGLVSLDIQALDDEDNPVPTGVLGELCMRGDQMMKGYWNKPELTAASVRNGWYHTGDLGCIDEHGAVVIMDRKKNMVISGGVNIYPAEVERVIGTLPGVAEVAAFGIPNHEWGEELVAIIYARSPLDEEALRAEARRQLGGIKCPKRFVISSNPLPRTNANKIARTALSALFKELTASVKSTDGAADLVKRLGDRS
jgi:fatty-acyl-CoA synthase